IRDFHVTGVQTCALPIYFVIRKNNIALNPISFFGQPLTAIQDFDSVAQAEGNEEAADQEDATNEETNQQEDESSEETTDQDDKEIGRATCRERERMRGKR